MARLKLEISSDRDHIQGPPDAPVTLVEYGDFECSYCVRAYAVVKRLQEILGDQMRFVFRNFPLTQVHPHAKMAAEAVEAAGGQGRFWEMYDALYEKRALEPQDIVSYAKDLGLDVERFVTDLHEEKFAPRVAEDRRSGLRSGVNGTPTFFINGVRHDGPWDLKWLLNALQTEIAARRRRAVG